MSNTTIAIIAVCIAVVLLLLFLLRGRKQHVGFGESQPVARAATPPMTVPVVAPPAAVPPIVVPTAPIVPEGHGVGAEMTAAIEDVIDQFVGTDAHPSGLDQIRQHGDPLTTLKGLGPRAATLLGQLGVTRFAQIAAWDESDVLAIDAQMGAFKGRIARDRWVEQARLLAAGDQAGFEERFGKLGG